MPVTKLFFRDYNSLFFCTQAGVLGFQLFHELKHAAGQDRPSVVQRRPDARQRLGAGAAVRPQMGVSSDTVRKKAHCTRSKKLFSQVNYISHFTLCLCDKITCEIYM